MDADSISTKGIVPEAPLFSRIELFVTFADIPMARIPKNRRPIFLIRMFRKMILPPRMFRKMILLIRRNPIQMSRMELLPMTKPPVTVHLMKSCHPPEAFTPQLPSSEALAATSQSASEKVSEKAVETGDTAPMKLLFLTLLSSGLISMSIYRSKKNML